MAATIAFIAHQSQINALVSYVQQHEPLFARYRILATATIAQRLGNETSLGVESLAAETRGGELQIAAAVVTQQISVVICLMDGVAPTPNDPDLLPLLRVCQLYNVPIATNLATAEAIATSIAQSRVAHLIFNPVAGRATSEQDLALIQECLSPHLHLETHITEVDTSIDELVQQALNAQADMVIASGGDGTISAVASALIGSNVPLGVIARGTANAFSVSLGIPSAIAPLPPPIREACQILLKGHTRQIDVAFCNGIPFTLLTAIGFEAETVERATRDLKTRWGALAYLVAGWQQLNEENLFNVEVEVDGEVKTFEAGAITIANAAPPTSILAQGAGQVVIDDGKLDVTVASAETKLQAIQTMFSMLGSALVKNNNREANLELPNVVHFYAQRIKVTTTPPQKVVVDGEMIGTTPVEIECKPLSLNVVVP